MNEKEKAETLARPGGLQRPQESSDEKTVRECKAKEAQLYAARGYGGYINTEEINELREKQKAAQDRITELRESNKR